MTKTPAADIDDIEKAMVRALADELLGFDREFDNALEYADRALKAVMAAGRPSQGET